MHILKYLFKNIYAYITPSTHSTFALHYIATVKGDVVYSAGLSGTGQKNRSTEIFE